MRTQISKRKLAALTFWEVVMMLVVLVGLTLVLSLGALRSKRAETHRISCISHLKFIGIDFRTWGWDHGDKFPMQLSFTNGGTLEAALAYQHFSVISNELFSPQHAPLCGANANRSDQFRARLE